MLQQLAAELGYAELEQLCEKAFEQEQEHLENVRSWLSAMTLGEALALQALAEEEEPSDREAEPKSGRQRAKSRSSRPKSKSTGRRKKRK